MIVGIHTSEDDAAAIRLRFQARRALANYALYPEGYRIQNNINGETPRELTLLTPPDQVAVRRADGTWYRRPRNPTEDGPRPYTMHWYLEYIRAGNLPSWFMRPEHLVYLVNNEEAKWLSLGNLSASDNVPAVGYLEMRYPTPPLYPRRDVFGNGQAYAYDLMPAEQLYLSRRFPATAANGANGDYRVYVHPNGYIEVRERMAVYGAVVNEPAGERLLEERTTWEPETDTNFRASYIIEGEHDHVTPPLRASSASRAAANTAAAALGGLVNPREVPAGLGNWQWLQPHVDQPLAHAQAIDTPFNATRLREAGALAPGLGGLDEPAVVFYPNVRYLNPTTQPTAHGRWEYLTAAESGSSRHLAHLNFGGGDDFGFEDNPTLTAAELWELRSEYLQANLIDPTREVDIVWIPEGDSPPPPPPTPSTPSTPGSSITADPGDEYDIDSELLHQPLNRGENNQTGVYGQRHYQSRMINGKQYTVDRQRAHAPLQEPHKSWICNNNGRWHQWKGYSTLDWSDRNEVEKMNKWREQAFARHFWPKKRRQARPDYTQEQRRHVFDNFVKPVHGGQPSETTERITELFNARFQQARDASGIGALLDRLRKEYEKYNGQMKPHRGRGENKRDRTGHNRRSEPEEASEPRESEDGGSENGRSEGGSEN